MKRPKPSVMKVSFPTSHALAAGKKVLAAFAHHAPTAAKPIERMSRPGKAHGPHNG